MKNIQIVDAADNCTYDIFAATEEEFNSIFPNDTDVEFAEDLFGRLGEERASAIITPIWQRRIDKKVVQGIHGTLFYQLLTKKPYYPTKREDEMVTIASSSKKEFK